MSKVWKASSLLSAVLVGILVAATLAACSTTTSPSPSPSASAKPSTSPAAATAASPSASAKPSGSASTSPSASASANSPANAQTFQKAQENWSKIVEDARKEGTAIVNAVSDQDMLAKWQAGFNKVDPKIQISIVRKVGAATTEQVKAEAATKNYSVNGYWGGGTSARQMVADGLMQDISADVPAIWDPAAKWAVSPLYDKGHPTLTGTLTTYHFIYNTDLIKPADMPKTWKDLADPRWKGKISFWDPRIAGHGQQAMAILHGTPGYGPDVVRKIVENMVIAPDGVSIARNVAKGEVAMGMITYSAYIPVKDGPVKLWVPEDGTFLSPTQLVIVKNAPQLNIMKVFANWLLSKEGQLVSSDGLGIVRADVTPVIPEIQLGAVKAFPDMPITWDQEQSKSKDAIQIVNKWIDELGK